MFEPSLNPPPQSRFWENTSQLRGSGLLPRLHLSGSVFSAQHSKPESRSSRTRAFAHLLCFLSSGFFLCILRAHRTASPCCGSCTCESSTGVKRRTPPNTMQSSLQQTTTHRVHRHSPSLPARTAAFSAAPAGRQAGGRRPSQFSCGALLSPVTIVTTGLVLGAWYLSQQQAVEQVRRCCHGGWLVGQGGQLMARDSSSIL